MSQAEIPDDQSEACSAGRGSAGNITPLFRKPERPPASAAPPAVSPLVSFNREELREILGLYGRKVAEGEWRDYAINFTQQKAVFSVFRRASEMPLYRIEKDPALGIRQGTYAAIVATGLILRRSNDLTRVLSALEKKPRLVVV